MKCQGKHGIVSSATVTVQQLAPALVRLLTKANDAD
jgi:hypothetical protein